MTGPRVLAVVPGNNTTVERELAAFAPEIGRLDVARVRRKPGMLTLADLPEYEDSTIAAVEPFAADPPDLVVFACTAAGFIGGSAGNRRVVDRLAARLARPVVSTAGAMAAALGRSGARRIDVVTPYLADVNDGLRAFLADESIEVLKLDSFFCPTVQALGAVTAEEVRMKALATADKGDALFIACAQLPTLAILTELRARLRRPVWSSVHATAWAALAALGLPNDRLDGARPETGRDAA
jgi:arylmalonate decarboxylase